MGNLYSRLQKQWIIKSGLVSKTEALTAYRRFGSDAKTI